MELESSAMKRKLNSSLCLSVQKKRKLNDENSSDMFRSLNKSTRSVLSSLDVNLIGIPHHCEKRSVMHALNTKPEKTDLPKPFKALPMPIYPPPSIHLPTKEPTRPLKLTLHSELRNEKREKYYEMITALKEKVKIEENRLKNERDKKEIEEIKKNALFKARPLPDLPAPAQVLKSSKPLTIPIELKFETEARAQKKDSKKNI